MAEGSLPLEEVAQVPADPTEGAKTQAAYPGLPPEQLRFEALRFALSANTLDGNADATHLVKEAKVIEEYLKG